MEKTYLEGRDCTFGAVDRWTEAEIQVGGLLSQVTEWELGVGNIESDMSRKYVIFAWKKRGKNPWGMWILL